MTRRFRLGLAATILTSVTACDSAHETTAPSATIDATAFCNDRTLS
jgi:hypothetical protein